MGWNFCVFCTTGSSWLCEEGPSSATDGLWPCYGRRPQKEGMERGRKFQWEGQRGGWRDEMTDDEGRAGSWLHDCWSPSESNGVAHGITNDICAFWMRNEWEGMRGRERDGRGRKQCVYEKVKESKETNVAKKWNDEGGNCRKWVTGVKKENRRQKRKKKQPHLHTLW